MTTGIPERCDDQGRDGHAQEHADQAAGRRHHGRLDQELLDDVAAARAEGAADADLAGALGDRRQHDVHDPDPADQERDAGDRAQHQVEDPLGRLGLLQQLERDGDRVVLLGVELAEQAVERRRRSS